MLHMRYAFGPARTEALQYENRIQVVSNSFP